MEASAKNGKPPAVRTERPLGPVNTNTQPHPPSHPVPLVLTACVGIAGCCWIQTGRGTRVLWGLTGLSANLHPCLVYTGNPAHHGTPHTEPKSRVCPAQGPAGGAEAQGGRGDWQRVCFRGLDTREPSVPSAHAHLRCCSGKWERLPQPQQGKRWHSSPRSGFFLQHPLFQRVDSSFPEHRKERGSCRGSEPSPPLWRPRWKSPLDSGPR